MMKHTMMPNIIENLLPMVAEIKQPLAKILGKDVPSAASSSHANPKNSNAMLKSDNVNESIAKPKSTIKEQEKSLGNPGWPSKIENPVVVQPNSSHLGKG